MGVLIVAGELGRRGLIVLPTIHNKGQITVHPRHGIDLAHVADHGEWYVSTTRLEADADAETEPEAG